MTDRELMQQALDALEAALSDDKPYISSSKEAIESLRARLAQPEQEHSEQWWRHEVSNAYANGYEKGRASVKQPEQEPVAWMHEWNGDVQINNLPAECYGDHWTRTPLYTAPPQREWQGLTYKERCELWNIASTFSPDSVIMHDFAKDIERALKERNS